MNNKKIASELVKLAKSLLAEDKPKVGDSVQLINSKGKPIQQHIKITEVVKKGDGNTWLVKDSHNDEYDIKKEKNGWIEDKGYETFEYHINLDERGEFSADVRDDSGETVFEIKTGDEEEGNIFEDGFMSGKDDMDGLKEHLVSLKIMDKKDQLENHG